MKSGRVWQPRPLEKGSMFISIRLGVPCVTLFFSLPRTVHTVRKIRTVRTVRTVHTVRTVAAAVAFHAVRTGFRPASGLCSGGMLSQYFQDNMCGLGCRYERNGSNGLARPLLLASFLPADRTGADMSQTGGRTPCPCGHHLCGSSPARGLTPPPAT